MPFLDPPPLAFAHRGGAADGDENTAEAFSRAIKTGFTYVETDAHSTRDGVPVVFHDDTLTRLTGESGRIADLTWKELASVRVAGAAAVPRLDDILGAWPAIRFNIDVKADAAAGPVVDAVRKTEACDRVLLASFNDARLEKVRALAGPSVATSLGKKAVARLWVASRARLTVRFPASAAAAQVPVRHGRITVVDRRFVRAAHRSGLQVHVWTIDDAPTMNWLLDLGVDGIMTDRVDVLRDVYRARGIAPFNL